MPRITISYRRDDSLAITGRIFDRLGGHFGREAVFCDIDSVPLGADFHRPIDWVLDESDITLSIVGPRWIGPDNEQLCLASPVGPVQLARVSVDSTPHREQAEKKSCRLSWEEVPSTERVERRLAVILAARSSDIAASRVRTKPAFSRGSNPSRELMTQIQRPHRADRRSISTCANALAPCRTPITLGVKALERAALQAQRLVRLHER